MLLTHKNVMMVAAIATASFLSLFLLDPFPQPQVYHQFADEKSMWGIPNFMNVTSNIGFLVVGIWGLVRVRQAGPKHNVCWLILALCTLLLTFASAYYHWLPSNGALVWDRLPMSVGFMAILVGIISERLDARLQRLLLPAGVLGASSVIYWAFTDDLRFYGWVQFFPFLIIVVMLAIFPKTGQDRYLWGAFVVYGLAKLTELLDHQIFAVLKEVIGGHPIKHLLSALGLWLLLKAFLNDRRAIYG